MLDVDLIRKLASIEAGRRYLEDPEEDSLDAVYCSKLASAEDQGLLAIASRLPGDAIKNYEILGGTYKSAFDIKMLKGAPEAIGKVIAPAAASVKQTANVVAKPISRPPTAAAAGPAIKRTIHGQAVPGVADLRATHAVNQELGGAQSLLGAHPARGLNW